MKNLFNLKNIAIVILVAIILVEIFIPNGVLPGKTIRIDGKKYEVIKYAIDTVDVIKTKIVTKKGKDIYHDTTIYVPIPTDKPIDTLSILKEFYAMNVYKDVLTLPDSLGTISLVDTISQNRILGRTYNASVKQRTIKETTIVKELPKTQLYWGLNSNFNKQDFVSSVGTGLILKTKKDKLYQVNLGVNNQTYDGVNGEFTPYVGAGVYWKIRLKK